MNLWNGAPSFYLFFYNGTLLYILNVLANQQTMLFWYSEVYIYVTFSLLRGQEPPIRALL